MLQSTTSGTVFAADGKDPESITSGVENEAQNDLSVDPGNVQGTFNPQKKSAMKIASVLIVLIVVSLSILI